MQLKRVIWGVLMVLSTTLACFAQDLTLDQKQGSQSLPQRLESELLTFQRLQMAAAQGDATAQFQLAAMYQDGRGIVQSDQEALRYYSKAAQQDHAAAQFYLARLYEQDGVLQDYKQAVKWYRKASEQGYSVKHLAAMYYDGRGVKQNISTAFELFKSSAEAGDIDAQYQLGKMYQSGQGVQRSHAQAVEWFQRAARHGHGEARFILESMGE